MPKIENCRIAEYRCDKLPLLEAISLLAIAAMLSNTPATTSVEVGQRAD
jgi:hypothetical protein